MRAVLKTTNRYCGPAGVLERVEGYAAACDLHGITVQRPLDVGASAR